MKNIVIIGFMGTGKTQTAKALADELSLEYVSVDELIEKKEDRSINDIFREDGEKYFRAVEKEIVKEVSEGENQVIDAGGGVVLDEENMKNLKKSGIVICLWASPEVIHERTKEHGHRPLLNVEDPEGKIRDLLDERKPFYEKADEHIDTSDMDLQSVVSNIKEILNDK